MSGRAAVSRSMLVGMAVALGLLAGCGGDASGPGGATGTLSGTVRAASGGAAIEGATVSVGTRHATSDASGHYELSGITLGNATVTASRPGFVTGEATVTITEGSNTRDFPLSVQEVYVSGSEATYVPQGVGALRGVLIVLGGPTTSGFVTGGRIAPVDNDPLEASLQAHGVQLRNLARTARMALLGRTPVNMPDAPASDEALFTAIRNVGAASGHPELESAPVLLYGLSAGSRESSGFLSRQADHVIGLLLRVPVAAPELSGTALAVPAFVMQAELDAQVTNDAIRAIFLGNRGGGGRWSLGVEPGVIHGEASATGNAAAINWLTAVLGLRLPTASGGPLNALSESSGWLGDQVTFVIAPWADYPGTRNTASWFPNAQVASSWRGLVTAGGGGGGIRQ